MKRVLILFALFTLVTAVSACSEKKPPEPAAVKSRNILSVIRSLNKSYEKKDLAGFLSDVADNYADRDVLIRSLTALFSKYEVIHFNIQYTKMLIMVQDKGPIKASFNWDGEWVVSGGALQKNSGRTTLMFDPVNFKLQAIEGKNPFVLQQGEMPGNKL
jgi:hypothetical protein